MISLESVVCTSGSGGLGTLLLDGVTAVLPTNRRFMVLSPDAAGNSSFIRLVAGAISPLSGSVRRTARVSFPVGFQRGFDPRSTTARNIQYVCDLYDADYEEVLAFVAHVTKIDQEIGMEVGELPRALRVKLAYALGYAIPFDTYLIDGVIGAGDREFREKCLQMFQARARSSGVIMALSDPRAARHLGDSGAVLFNGKLYVYDDIQSAVEMYESIRKVASPLTPVAADAEDDA